MSLGILYVVATPIGNLEDISLRALRILREVDLVLCEDTRVTSKLLQHYEIKTRTESCHHHTDDGRLSHYVDMLAQGKNIAIVSDAGTPGISDPGGRLVAATLERFGDDVRVESVPGPSAVTAALSISGIQTDKFVFMGFPPHKKGRQTFIAKIFDSAYPVVVYESKHRIDKFLEELDAMNRAVEEKNRQIDDNPYTKHKEEKRSPVTSVVACRELSKMHETVYRGEIMDILEKIKSSQNDQKGEFTLVIGK